MPDQDPPVPEAGMPVPRPETGSKPQPGRPPAARRRDLAETTGYLAGRTATGVTRLLLRNKTVRRTLRNARDSIRENS